MTKPTKWHVHPAKTQISLGICPVWSESSLCARRKLGSLATHWAHSEDSDQTGRMPRLIWVFTGRKDVGFVMRRLKFPLKHFWVIISISKTIRQDTQEGNNHSPEQVSWRLIEKRNKWIKKQAMTGTVFGHSRASNPETMSDLAGFQICLWLNACPGSLEVL